MLGGMKWRYVLQVFVKLLLLPSMCAKVSENNPNKNLLTPATLRNDITDDAIILVSESFRNNFMNGDGQFYEFIVNHCTKSGTISSPLCRIVSYSFPGIFLKPSNEKCFNDTLVFISWMDQRNKIIPYIQQALSMKETVRDFVESCINTTHLGLDNKYCVGSVVNTSYNLSEVFVHWLPRLGAAVANSFIGNDSVKVMVKHLCVPSSCVEEDIQEGLHIAQLLQGRRQSISTTFCHQKQTRETSVAMATLITVLTVLVVIQVCCTVYECYLIYKYNRKEEPLLDVEDKLLATSPGRSVLYVPDKEITRRRFLPKFAKAFSLCSNIKKLFNLKSKSAFPELHGIRVLSMLWLFLGTAFLVCLLHPESDEKTLTQLLRDIWFQPVISSFTAVETFFILSGLVSGYALTRRNSSSEEGIPYKALFYHLFRRYLRLLPTTAVVLLLAIVVPFPHNYNPHFQVFEELTTSQCHHKWWANLAFIQNFFKINEGVCLPHTWFIACDFQMCLVTLFFMSCIVSQESNNSQGLMCFGMIGCLTFMAPIFVTEILGLAPGLVFNKAINFYFLEYYYVLPYSHFFEYVSGVWVGVYLASGNSPRKMKGGHQVLAWILWSIALMFRILGFYLYNLHPEITPKRYETGLMSAVHKGCWVFVVLWVIYVCVTDQADILKRFLSHKLFIPFSRLSYSIYLVGFPIQSFYMASLDHPPQISSTLDLVVFNYGLFSLAVMVAMGNHLLIESPLNSACSLVLKYFNKDPMVKKPWKGKMPVIVLDPVERGESPEGESNGRDKSGHTGNTVPQDDRYLRTEDNEPQYKSSS